MSKAEDLLRKARESVEALGQQETIETLSDTLRDVLSKPGHRVGGVTVVMQVLPVEEPLTEDNPHPGPGFAVVINLTRWCCVDCAAGSLREAYSKVAADLPSGVDGQAVAIEQPSQTKH